MDNDSLWRAVQAELELDTSSANYNSWLKPTALSGIKTIDEKRQIVTIACRSPFQQSMVEARYYGQIKQALDRLSEKQNELVFTVEVEKITEPQILGPLFEQQGQQKGTDSAYEEAVERVRLRKDYVFDTFAVSSTNEMAHAAALAVARSPGEAYHLLFLYGGVGVGKTHLMNAIGHEILRQEPRIETIYCSGEEFMNDLVAAIQTKKTTQFKARYRKLKLFLVDDIQFIAGKDAAQEEFFHTFNAIVQNQGQIVLTSDKLPEEMILLEDRLRSRFEGGLTIDIQEPNFELRTAILNIKARARGINLPLDVAQMIAGQIKSTRKLEGFLVRLMTKVSLRNEPITPEMTEHLLGLDGELTVKLKQYIPPLEVIDQVATFFSFKPAALKGKRRTKDLVKARHVAMYLLRKDLEVGLEEIGRVFGGRDHTTVMHAVDKITNLIPQSERLRRELEGVTRKVFAEGGKRA
ncbi:MAG: chromosomal replication initiator protein DnaA [Candidatus Chisholmbacteria bacterium]|nr:chromosomal replication initiator protein DnaA [Candidatus Chisholmbacteria bacterium]